ncbi:MAG: type III-B CRISPR module RAMP protein Cmr4 [Methanosarcinales archaeon]|nr:type III-B CRISPR module RAMP protein Cmr4 [Methanosarcinales archaeon]
MNNGNNPEKKFAYALDPIHIGAGGYQLGRVDNSIVRDPTTGVPKIPGTSLAGVIRAYAEIVKDQNAGNRYDIDTIFGTEEKAGVLRFYDGHIIFFPVNSIYGTVWITTRELLEYWCKNGEKGIEINIPSANDEVSVLQGLGEINDKNSIITLGWLMLEAVNANGDLKVKVPSKLAGKNVVMVSGKLFSHIVNDNLEVRTSVSIDPETGAAKDGALFTYEAIPRCTILGFEIGEDPRKNSNNLNIPELLKSTYPYLKMLGIGGMGTRGFGRLKIL